MDWQGIAVLLTAFAAILNYWFQYNQHSKNKLIDFKIEKLRSEEKIRNKRDKEASSRIFGTIWHILYESHAARVYIIQPHPLTHNLYMTVYYEARDNGVMSIRDIFSNMPVGDVAGLASEMRTRDFIYWPAADDIKDNHARAIMRNAGAETLVIKKLSDDRREWIGSIVIDYAQRTGIEVPYIKGLLHEAANDIQYSLPEIENQL